MSSLGGGNGGGGNAGDRNLCRPLPEHCRTIYYDKDNYGPLYGGGVASRGAGFEAVVGAGEHRSGGYTGGIKVVGGGKGLRGAGGIGYIGRDVIISQVIL